MNFKELIKSMNIEINKIYKYEKMLIDSGMSFKQKSNDLVEYAIDIYMTDNIENVITLITMIGKGNYNETL